MWMYTELILGCSFKKDTPDSVIETLRYLVWDIEIKPDSEILRDDDYMSRLFLSSSYYFWVNNSVQKMWFDNIRNELVISIRSNLKNYHSEIERFIEWIKPYVSSGSWKNDMYAISIYEEDKEPTIYYRTK